MHLKEIEYGSLLAYCPRGDSDEIISSKHLMAALKQDRYVKVSSKRFQLTLMSDWVAEMIEGGKTGLPFSDFFGRDVLLVPAPRSSLMRAGTLWVPERIATALAKKGLGKIAVCLKRIRAVPRSAYSLPGKRPKPIEHFNSLEVQGNLYPPEDIVIVDDIITLGSTICGAANRLAEAFPDSTIRAFAAMRTISDPEKFEKSFSPVKGMVSFREKQGVTTREP